MGRQSHGSPRLVVSMDPAKRDHPPFPTPQAGTDPSFRHGPHKATALNAEAAKTAGEWIRPVVSLALSSAQIGLFGARWL